MARLSSTEHVCVAIVGGGIAGLSLARMLEQVGISYALWEAKQEFAPNLGASVGLGPQGLRILDQLGVVEQLEVHEVEHHSWEHRDANGNLHATFTSWSQLRPTLGYSGIFLERQRLEQILYDSVKDKFPLRTSKRVISIKDSEHAATLVASDGTSLTCEFVAGADGVRSLVRREIERKSLGSASHGGFDAKFACVYGISDPHPAIGPGRHFTVYRPDASLLVFTGMDGVAYWFLFEELKRTIQYNARERFSQVDIDRLFAQTADTLVTDGVRWAEIIQRRRVAIMAALEEGIADTMFHGRMLLLGDSAHKMTPHSGMGANQALESAAAFVNVLRSLLAQTHTRHIPASKIRSCLAAYERRRKLRVTEATEIASMKCRMELKIGPDSDVFWQRLGKMSDEQSLGLMLRSFSGAEYLEKWPCGGARVAQYCAAADAIRRNAASAPVEVQAAARL
ncbi:hypothetical protein N7492_002599 [Penicillium capsulatum]|uniref:FAD-binding domain-containing protein n=1 Tax=Penicillium capsulatum TaxID=69766 RepID=A0A9W9IKC3_9EURO|nr:hypothetical protein N7492_002599 [Penicillium capsulatum]KAJ6122800.1 hypothetical protein N7512_005265 [Penicillium capsulatum]